MNVRPAPCPRYRPSVEGCHRTDEAGIFAPTELESIVPRYLDDMALDLPALF